ncbi:MAG: methionyl-tRNA synthetase [Parcubacteria group bacterium Gr01-1014_56]|nr:MAG: methionyl-tRNA synthetase [Parcubacteria group bacterium Gr01-1014_56]
MADKFYLTTPIFYPNAKLHLGHAYVVTLSDIIARYHRLVSDKTYFLTGSDENTQKIIKPAELEGKTPQEFLDEKVESFRSLFTALNISYDQFIRTTDQKVHWPGAQMLWSKLVEAGDIYKKEYEGLYCVGHEAFITDKELVDGKCPDHGTVPERIKEENYFFRLSKYTDAITQKIESGELAIVPETREREILSLLREGLQDVSFSRPRNTNSVGIPVPGDDTQVIYVWCDALANYITALGYGQDETLFKEFWPADVHIVGKDILRFHAAIWPGMLLSAGIPLPKKILVHGMVLSGGKKMSKTLGNVIDPEELLTEYGTDAVRYYLARHISPFEDGDITREHFKDAYNANLANGLGNLASRIMQLAQTHLTEPVKLTFTPYPKGYTDALEKFEVNRASDMVWERIKALDTSITQSQPFKVVKEDLERGRELIAELVRELAAIDLLLEPFMPETSKKIIEAIMANKKPENLFPRKD